MKKTLIALVAVSCVSLSSTATATAVAEPAPQIGFSSVASETGQAEVSDTVPKLAEPTGQDTSGESDEDGSSDASIITAVAVIGTLALVAAAVGGAAWAIYERIIPNPLPGIIPTKWVPEPF